MTYLLGFATAFLLSRWLTGVIRRYAIRGNLMDSPNSRSSHSVPTPRGGGLAIVVVVTAMWTFGAALGLLPWNYVLAPACAGALVAVIGFVDDHGHVAVGWRMLVHVVAAAIVVGVHGGIDGLSLFGADIQLGWFAVVLGIFWLVWMLNLYNFMDGIDGIAGAEAVTVSLGASICLFASGNVELAVVVAIVGAASLGFLVVNWPPARIFMGDVGSAYLGFVFGALAIVSHQSGALSIWVWLILLGAFIVDATMTLIVRVGRGEKWYSAHRSHAYQAAARRYGGHWHVTVGVTSLNLLWLLPLAYLASSSTQYAWLLALVAWTPLVLIALYFGAGRSND